MNKVTIDRDVFDSKLKMAFDFIPPKASIPAFSSFKLGVSKESMEIIAGDGQTQIKVYCPCKSKTDFIICVPALLLHKTVSLLKDSEVNITHKEGLKIELKSGKSKYTIAMDCEPAAYGTMPFETVINEITMPQMLVKSVLKTVGKFINEKHPKLNFTAMNINMIDNRIVFTGATDFTICRAAIKPISIHSWEKVNLPLDSAKKVINLLDDKGEIGIVSSGKKIKFFTSEDSNEHFEVICTAAAIQFPDSERLFKSRPKDSLVFNTLELKDCIRRLELYAEKGIIKPSVAIKGVEELILIANDVNIGNEGEESMTVTNEEKVMFDKRVDIESMLSILSEIEANESKVYFVDGDNKGLSFIVPEVATEEENIYSFLVSSCH